MFPYVEPIDVEEVDLGELPDDIPMQRKKTRGRPRIYPRLEDVLRYKKSLQEEKNAPIETIDHTKESISDAMTIQEKKQENETHFIERYK